MYFKVALISFSIIVFSGCSSFFSTNPKTPGSNGKKLGIKVVEVIDEAPAVISKDSNESITTIEDSPIKEKKVKNKKPYLKPEPFSLESHEDDPELLGPQSTIDTPLTRANDDVDKNTTN